MLKVKLKMGTTYSNCPSEIVEFNYNGDEEDFRDDGEISTEILNMISNREFPHYYLEIKTKEMLIPSNEVKTKVTVTVGTTYSGCPFETVEFDYDGSEAEFDIDNFESTNILNMLFNQAFPHYYLEIETKDICDES